MLNLVFLLEGARRPDYAWMGRFISELSLGPDGWIQKTGFIVGGVGVGLGAIGLHLAFDDVRWSRPVLLIAGVGGCLVLAGVFDTDPLPLRSLTAPGLLHDGFAFSLFVCMVGAGFGYAQRFSAEPGWHAFTLASTWVTLFFFLLVVLGFPLATRPPSLSFEPLVRYVGLSQRMAQGAFFIWLAALSWRAANHSFGLRRG